MRHSALLRRFERADGAQAMIEFALTLPVILLVITGLFDLGRAVWQENSLAYAAREGTRYAIVHGSAGTPVAGPCTNCAIAAITTVVVNAAPGVPSISVLVDYPAPPGGTSCNHRNCLVSVIATAPFVPMPSQYLLGGTFTLTLKGASQLVIQR